MTSASSADVRIRDGSFLVGGPDDTVVRRLRPGGRNDVTVYCNSGSLERQRATPHLTLQEGRTSVRTKKAGRKGLDNWWFF